MASLLALAGMTAFTMNARAAATFPPEFDLATLLEANGGDGTLGFVLNGASDHDFSGGAVSGAGDVNGDGIGDLVIGAPQTAVPNPDDQLAGQTYIVFGRIDHGAEIDLGDLLPANGGDGTEGLAIDGRFGGYYDASVSGSAVSGVGDVDGDGFADVLIGAHGSDYRGSSSGEAYLVFGAPGGFPPEVDFGDATVGTTITAGCTSGYQGYSLSFAGDFNGDAIDDFLLGTPGDNNYYSADKRGVTDLIFGDTDTWPATFNPCTVANGDGSGGAKFQGIYGDYYNSGDESGKSVSGGGDVNGDGYDDILIGAPERTLGDLTRVGESYLIFGRASGLTGTELLADLLPENGGDGTEGIVLDGVASGDLSGDPVAIIGDLNGDGLDDFAISAPSATSNSLFQAGQVYVVFGRSSGFSADLQLASLLPANGGDGSSGVVFGGPGERADAGQALSGVGDINGDGLADMIIGASGLTFYVIYGRETPFPALFNLEQLLIENGGDGREGFVLHGALTVGRAGDLNSDGINDLIMGNGTETVDGQPQVGRTYVLFGRNTPFDADADGVADPSDNCLLVKNPDQRDTDGDGIGSVCDADLNNDCSVNFRDLGIMKAAFFTSVANIDLNGDGHVNFADLALMRAGFFLPPGPSGLHDLCDEAVPDSGSK